MRAMVAGVGYTGRRVLAAVPDAIGLNRSPVDDLAVQIVDLDAEFRLPDLDTPYTLLYTIPPADDDDPRLARLLEALDPLPRRIVYLSTSGVYGDRGGARVGEDSPTDPRTERARRRVSAERLLSEWCTKGDVELRVLRVPAIYGPGRLGLDRLRADEPILAESDAAPGNRIHVDDLVACCVAALTSAAPGGIYNVGDGDHRSGSAFSLAVARIAGLPAPTQVSMDEAEKTFSAARLSFLRESRRLDTSKMRDELGVLPRFADPEDGIRASLAVVR